MSCIIDMVIVMASATVLNNVYAPGMTHAPNNTSAYVTYPSTNKTEQIETHLPDFGGTLAQNRTDRFIPESRIEKNEDEVFVTAPTPAAAHFAANSGAVPEASDLNRSRMS